MPKKSLWVHLFWLQSGKPQIFYGRLTYTSVHILSLTVEILEIKGFGKLYKIMKHILYNLKGKKGQSSYTAT